MSLPDRGRAAEDAFLAAAVDADVEELAEWVGEAIEARRPMLAARLVGLIPEGVDLGADLEPARRAARFLLVDAEGERQEGWSELEDAWAIVRAKRIRRIKQRMRRALNGGRDDRRRRR